MAASSVTERLPLADWSLSKPPFGELRVCEGIGAFPVMSFELAGLTRAATDHAAALCAAWMDLPTHPNILEAIEVDESRVWLRYAAIHWRRVPPVLDAADVLTSRIAASIGLQLCDVYRSLSKYLRPRELALFARPRVVVDLDGRPRVAFWPPETLSAERNLVELVGALLAMLVRVSDSARASRIATILDRSDSKAKDHIASLDELATAFEAAGASELAIRRGERLEGWRLVEEGIGWLEVGRPDDALEQLTQAAPLVRGATIHLEAVVRARREGATVRSTEPLLPRRQWSDAKPEGLELERSGSFASALRLYRTVDAAPTDVVEVECATARCHLRLDQADVAIEVCMRVLSRDAAHVGAHAMLTAAHLLVKRHAEAVGVADRWVALAPDDAAAHYARGRALFAVRRLREARASFERALVLRPQMIEAMLLRREVDRAAGAVRDAVGVEAPVELAIPEQLAAIRDALVVGDLDAVVETLARPEHSRDVLAQLIRARCLLQLVRIDDALTVVDAVLAVDPDHLDAIELRAQVFVHLGRTEDADAEYRRFIARAEAASDPRVRAVRE